LALKLLVYGGSEPMLIVGCSVRFLDRCVQMGDRRVGLEVQKELEK
jgi:hypothetical protein